MKHLKSYKLFENQSQVDKKIQLLKDLSTDFTDMGLVVEIWKEGKSIIMLIKDERDDAILSDDNYYEENLYNKEKILDFEETLKSYGMNFRSKSGGGDAVYYKFDKWGKMTNTDIVR